MVIKLYTCQSLLKTAASWVAAAHRERCGDLGLRQAPLQPLDHLAQPTCPHRGILPLHRASRAPPIAPPPPPPLAPAKSPTANHHASTNCSCHTPLVVSTAATTSHSHPKTRHHVASSHRQRRGVNHGPGRGNPPPGGRRERPLAPPLSRITVQRAELAGSPVNSSAKGRVGKVGRCRRTGSCTRVLFTCAS